MNVVHQSTLSQILTKVIQAQNIDEEHKTPTGDFCQNEQLMKVWRMHKYCNKEETICFQTDGHMDAHTYRSLQGIRHLL